MKAIKQEQVTQLATKTFDHAYRKCKEIDYNPGNVDTVFMSIALDTLARLVIEECAGVAGCNGHVSGFALGDLIKEHFGILEDE